jgi:hypothetical protein
VRAALAAAHAADGTAPLAPLEPVPPPPVAAYGDVPLTASAPLLSAPALAALGPPGDGGRHPDPVPMEDVGHGHGLILYRTAVPAAAFACDGADSGGDGGGDSGARVLDVGGAVHDYATVILGGGGAGDEPLAMLAGRLDRSSPGNLTLPCLPGVSTDSDAAAAAAAGPTAAATLTLDILVEGVGRDNFGCGSLDWKGLAGPGVRLGGAFGRRGGSGRARARTHTHTRARTHTRAARPSMAVHLPLPLSLMLCTP